ncbi:hypothetical protein JCM19294_2220 [Nonlabens tegetincola]|uniref:Uncharacterized protein n=1 Tax=Nonlabens tegetincola TaxID=323273 RepID=A0A090Q166_9FLAO|nr:hypothetical protein JCM19294_2220 [Nonlabens tegetincola]
MCAFAKAWHPTNPYLVINTKKPMLILKYRLFQSTNNQLLLSCLNHFLIVT